MKWLITLLCMFTLCLIPVSAQEELPPAEVIINYIPVLPDGEWNSTAVWPRTETVSPSLGQPAGSFVDAPDGYRFAGWYADPQCLIPVNSWWVGTSDELLPALEENTPSQTINFYAKFEYALASLTIYAYGSDVQSLIFTVAGNPWGDREYVELTAAIPAGQNSVTIVDLPAGEYTITEQDNWSWSCQPVLPQQTALTTDTVVTFMLTRNEITWLYDCAWLPKRDEY